MSGAPEFLVLEHNCFCNSDKAMFLYNISQAEDCPEDSGELLKNTNQRQ